VKVSRGVFEKVAPSFDGVMRKNAKLQYKLAEGVLEEM